MYTIDINMRTFYYTASEQNTVSWSKRLGKHGTQSVGLTWNSGSDADGRLIIFSSCQEVDPGWVKTQDHANPNTYLQYTYWNIDNNNNNNNNNNNHNDDNDNDNDNDNNHNDNDNDNNNNNNSNNNNNNDDNDNDNDNDHHDNDNDNDNDNNSNSNNNNKNKNKNNNKNTNKNKNNNNKNKNNNNNKNKNNNNNNKTHPQVHTGRVPYLGVGGATGHWTMHIYIFKHIYIVFKCINIYCTVGRSLHQLVWQHETL